MAIAPPDQTRIVNAALAELGSTTRVTSIDDGSNQANRAKMLWPDVLRDLLAEHPWNFAIRRAMLNESAEAPKFGWSRRFQLQPDCVRWLPPVSGTCDYFDGEREGNSLLTNREAPLPCRYIAYIDDVSQFPPKFVRALILKLAEAMAEGVTQSETIKQDMSEKAEAAIKKAKRVDGLETGQTRRGNVVAGSDWNTARRRGRFVAVR